MFQLKCLFINLYNSLTVHAMIHQSTIGDMPPTPKDVSISRSKMCLSSFKYYSPPLPLLGRYLKYLLKYPFLLITSYWLIWSNPTATKNISTATICVIHMLHTISYRAIWKIHCYIRYLNIYILYTHYILVIVSACHMKATIIYIFILATYSFK